MKTIGIIILMLVSLSTVTCISSESVENQDCPVFSLKGLLNLFSNSMVAFGRPLHGGPGSVL